MASKLIKILLVEAFSDHIEMIRQILEKEYTNYILEITDTKEGLKQAIQKHNPDIILSNIFFPAFEGKSIFNLAKELAPRTPFIFIANAAKEETLIYFFREGLADFVLKDNIANVPSSIKLALEKFESKNCSRNTEDNLQNRIKELEKKEYLYRTLVENSEVIYTVVDENLNPIYRSPIIEKITGYTPEEIHGYDIFEIIHPQDRDLVYDFIDELKSKHGQIIPTSFRLKLKNGKYCWFEGYGNNQLSNPKLNGIIFKFRDVSDRKKIETRLAEKEAKYRAIFENSLDGIILSQLDGQIIRANPAACKMFKMTEEEIISKGSAALIDKTDHRIDSLMKERITNGSTKGEATLIRKGGSKFLASVSVSKFTDSFARERVSVSIHDLSERLKSQGKLDTTANLLKETVNRLNKTLDASMDVICTIDGEGKFVDINAASLKIWGYTPQELKGTPFLDLVFKEDQKKTIKEHSNIKNGVVAEFFENRYVHKNGTIVSNLWSARWDEELQLVLCVAKDITDKKKSEKTIQLEKKRFQDLYEQASSSMCILKGPNHIYELANPPYLKLISKPDKSEIIGKTVKEVLPELESQGILEILDHVYQTGETFSASEMLFRFDFNGNGILDDVYLDLIYQAHRDSDGNIDGILVFANDVTEQVVSRKKIEESEKKYKELIHNLPIAIYACDPDGRILLYNKAAVDIWGREPEIGVDLWCGSSKIYHLDNSVMPLDSCPMALLLKTGEVHKGVGIIEKLNGEKRTVTADPVPYYDENGNLTGAVNLMTDITDRIAIERALKESEKKYRQIVETAQEGIWLLDKDHNTSFINNRMCDLLEFELEEVLNKKICHFLAEDNKENTLNELDRISEGHTVHLEAKFISKSGREIWTHISANPLFDDDNGFIGALAMFTDISESKRIALELERFNTELSSQIKLTQNRQEELLMVNKELSDYKFAIDESCNVAITDQNGIITHVNDNFCTISKYTKEELIGQDHRIFSSDYHSNKFIQTFWKTITKGKTWKGELKNRAKDGTEYWVDTTIIPFLDIKGKPYQYVTTQFDITERKKAEIDLDLQNRKLVKTNAELDRFVYSVSHDLRSPLTSILGLINFIEAESGEPDTIKHILMIRESVHRLDNFIKNILNYSRNNRISLKVQKIDLQKNINEIVRSYTGNPDTKDIEFIIDINQREPFYMDQIRLNTIIENLISNAIKYHKEEGTDNFIKISSDSDSKILKLTITDNGVGIDPKYHTKIFDMFYRLNSKKVGSGIGLYIVKETIEILQGTIEIESELNKGTSFIITLKNLKS